MQHKLYQIVLDDATVIAVQAAKTEHDYPEKFRAHRRAIMIGDAIPGLEADAYEHVATIEAEDLEDVFRVGNIGPEEQIARIKPMHSVSVGDIIVDPKGHAFIVKSFGFEMLVEEWESLR